MKVRRCTNPGVAVRKSTWKYGGTSEAEGEPWRVRRWRLTIAGRASASDFASLCHIAIGPPF
ncbi:hypothetical protein Gotur_010223 [Gossypium turneri]